MVEPSSKRSKVMGPSGSPSKFFKDSIHGTIEMEPVLVAIIDTPQFQRLRDIKQLGGAYWVYPGACHNRFEHSIGTSYLCGLMLTTLKSLHDGKNDSIVHITEKDILCVKIAGLIHDLGHLGPFSHLFDNFDNDLINLFDNQIIPRSERVPENKEWKHEEASCKLFDHMVATNTDLVKSFEDNEIYTQEIKIIKQMIKGVNKHSGKNQFLYEIVSNKATGIDCDKFDYFARDTHHVGIKNSFDFHRYFKNVRIMPMDDGQLRICARDKEESNLYEMFHTRWTLHRQVYQHKTVVSVEELLVQAFLHADKAFGICFPINEENMEKLTYLTDSIFYKILRFDGESPLPVTDETMNKEELMEAQKFLKRVQRRDLYLYCGEIVLRKIEVKDGSLKIENEDGLVKEIKKMMESKELKDHVFLHTACFNYGKKDKNPLNEMKFFDKAGSIIKEKRQLKDSENNMLPKNFEEKRVRVYCKSKEKFEFVKNAFHGWCKKEKRTFLY